MDSFNIHFWAIEDAELAKAMKIDTAKPGDLYLIKLSDSPFRSPTASNDQVFSAHGINFTSELFVPDQTANSLTYQKITKLCLSRPIVIDITNVEQFGGLVLQTSCLLVHCDPLEHT